MKLLKSSAIICILLLAFELVQAKSPYAIIGKNDLIIVDDNFKNIPNKYKLNLTA